MFNRPSRAASAIGWGCLLFVVLFWRLGAATFWDPDEAHYAQTSVELIASGDWLAPYYNAQPFFDKPILFHVLQSIPMRVLGPTEGASRLVPALAALAIVGTTWWIGFTLGSADIGLVAGLLLTVNPSLFALSRYGILDTVFTAFLFGGVAMLAVAALRERPRLQYGGYVLLALATLTKGPLAIVLAGLTFALAIAVSADARRRLLGLHWLLGLAMVAALSAPWFFYMWRRFDAAFVQGYVLNENVRLFAQPLYQGQPPWWFYIQLVVVGMLPWTGLILGRLYDDIRAWRTPGCARHLRGAAVVVDRSDRGVLQSLELQARSLCVSRGACPLSDSRESLVGASWGRVSLALAPGCLSGRGWWDRCSLSRAWRSRF